MRLTFLGTGTSFGVPVIGCGCSTCRSEDPRDRRGRHGALLHLPEGNLLIDTPPELRLQLLAAEVDQVDAVFYTHLHADHLHGIDDVRIFSTRGRGAVPALVPPGQAEVMASRFPYIFDDRITVPKGTTKPRIELATYEAGEPLELLGATLQPFVVPHGSMDVYGFRVGSLGYVTDAKSIPPEARAALDGVEVLVLNALWWGDPHPTHFNMEEAIEVARDIGARRTYLTHLTHRVGYQELRARLPSGIEPAFDGLAVDFKSER